MTDIIYQLTQLEEYKEHICLNYYSHFPNEVTCNNLIH